MKTKIYDRVKEALTLYPKFRNSDNALIFNVSDSFRDAVLRGAAPIVIMNEFMKIKFETIRRCRQKIQQLHPELGPTEPVRRKRKEIEKQKGTFVFREEVAEQRGLL